jgi:hypothetical protein
MELYQLEHPSDRIFLCTHSDCNEVADYLELNEEGGEQVFCAGHTSSDKHVSVLQKRACHTGYSFRSRPFAA